MSLGIATIDHSDDDNDHNISNQQQSQQGKTH